MVVLGADEEWRNIQLNHSYALPSSASLKEGICWTYAIIHKTLHDGIYIGRTTKSLYNLITNRAQNSIGNFSSTLFACPCLCPYLYSYPYTCLYSYLCSSDNVRDAKASWWFPACFVF
jgi:hypothetical protein